jgi:uncharacterized membrane protein
MRSKFSIGGHPLHPALVAVPIGLFMWAFAADILYLATDKNKMWYDISLYTGAAAVVTALVAALPGFGDYFTIALRSRAALQATAHMLLNLTLVGLFAGAFVLQLDNGALEGAELTIVVILHAVGVGFLSVSGYLGGDMSHRQHLAIVPHDEQFEREEEATHLEHAGVR